MTITTKPLQQLTAAEAEEWRAIQRENPALVNPFLSPEFAQAVAAVRPQACVAVLSEAGRPVGYFPFQRGPFGLGRPIGAGVSDCQGVIHRSGIAWDPDELLEACGLAVLEFDHLLDGQAPFAPHVRRREASPVIDLSAGYEGYLERRRGESRSFRRALIKQGALAREHEVRFELHAPDADVFAALTAWKSAQYRRTGRVDRFAKPWIRALVASLMQTQSDTFQGLLAVLRVGGRPIAVQACVASPTVLALWFPAFDPRWARYSPGMILRHKVIEAAAARGVRQVDMGKGHSPHKELLKTGELQVCEARMERGSARALVHRVYREPPRRLERFVLDHPGLRVAARHTLAGVGAARTRAHEAARYGDRL